MALRAGDLARRVGGTIGIAAEGVTMAAAMLAAGALALAFGWHWPGVAAILCGLATAAFFRDPERSPADLSCERLVLSGADGTVSDVAEMPLPDGVTGERYHRVSVFMSPLNVHVNRAPVSGEILSVRHTPGQIPRGLSRLRERAQRAQSDRAERRSRPSACDGADRGLPGAAYHMSPPSSRYSALWRANWPYNVRQSRRPFRPA